jgi:RhtB (resistance to homoserine/threonine) family protein
MAHLPHLIALLAVDLLAAMTPGPNFVLVTQTAIGHSFRQGAAVVLGLMISNLLWCAAVLFGLTSLFHLAPWLYTAIKLAGGAYLIVLGVQLWRSRGEVEAARHDLPERSPRTALLRGVLIGLSNPKSALYFGSVFALFVSPDTPAWVQATAVAVVLVNTAAWYGSVAALFSRPRVQRAYSRVQRTLNRVAGAVMAAFGVKLLATRS